MNYLEESQKDIALILERVELTNTKQINTAFKANTKLGKYVNTAYNIHKSDFSPARWGFILIATLELLEVIQKYFTDKEGKFKTPIFIGWFPVIITIVKFLKKVLS